MSHNKQEEQLSELQHDTRIGAMLQAIPGTPPPSQQSVSFNERKDALEAKLKAEIASNIDRRK